MPRTTLKIDGSVLRELKRRAREERKSLGDVVSELVGPALAQRSSSNKAARFRWLSARMGPPRIDLEDKEAVRRALASR
ncbi:MAG TPA: antitoxin [archaeon]|nr:antitoxin [archaeon]